MKRVVAVLSAVVVSAVARAAEPAAQALGSQLGAESVALDGIKRKTSKNDAAWMEKFRYLTRTQQALLLPAGVKTWQRPPWPPNTGVEEGELYRILGTLGKFGIWEDGCEFVPFYDDDGAVGGQPQTVLVGSYRKAGKVLAIFGNLSGEAAEFKLSIDRRKLKLAGALAPVNAETGETLAGGTVKLAPYDVMLVLIETSRTQVLSKWDFSGDGGKTWKSVELPHDAAIAGPFDRRHDMQKVKISENGEDGERVKTGRTGALPWIGEVEYRCKVSVPEGAGYAALFFDGVMGESEVSVDGKAAGGWKCGYNAFLVELPAKAGEYDVRVRRSTGRNRQDGIRARESTGASSWFSARPRGLRCGATPSIRRISRPSRCPAAFAGVPARSSTACSTAARKRPGAKTEFSRVTSRRGRRTSRTCMTW